MVGRGGASLAHAHAPRRVGDDGVEAAALVRPIDPLGVRLCSGGAGGDGGQERVQPTPTGWAWGGGPWKTTRAATPAAVALARAPFTTAPERSQPQSRPVPPGKAAAASSATVPPPQNGSSRFVAGPACASRSMQYATFGLSVTDRTNASLCRFESASRFGIVPTRTCPWPAASAASSVVAPLGS
jgi:hypothetical protein